MASMSSKIYNTLPVNCRTIGGPKVERRDKRGETCIHLINKLETRSNLGLVNVGMNMVLLEKEKTYAINLHLLKRNITTTRN